MLRVPKSRCFCCNMKERRGLEEEMIEVALDENIADEPQDDQKRFFKN